MIPTNSKIEKHDLTNLNRILKTWFFKCPVPAIPMVVASLALNSNPGEGAAYIGIRIYRFTHVLSQEKYISFKQIVGEIIFLHLHLVNI